MNASLPRILHLPWAAWPRTTSIIGVGDNRRARARPGSARLQILAIRFGAEIAPDRSRRPRCPGSFVSTTAVEPLEGSAVWRTLLGFLDFGKFTAGGE